METTKWKDDFILPLTIAFDKDKEKVVLFTDVGEKLKDATGLVMPKKCEKPADIPKHYAASVNAMAETVLFRAAMDIFFNLTED